MKQLSLAAAVAATLAVASAAMAQAVQTYSYDGAGRLIAVATTSGGTTTTTDYGLDDAHNRVSRTTASGSSLMSIGPTEPVPELAPTASAKASRQPNSTPTPRQPRRTS